MCSSRPVSLERRARPTTDGASAPKNFAGSSGRFSRESSQEPKRTKVLVTFATSSSSTFGPPTRARIASMRAFAASCSSMQDSTVDAHRLLSGSTVLRISMQESLP